MPGLGSIRHVRSRVREARSSNHRRGGTVVIDPRRSVAR